MTSERIEGEVANFAAMTFDHRSICNLFYGVDPEVARVLYHRSNGKNKCENRRRSSQFFSDEV
jgi:hypothetical protein